MNAPANVPAKRSVTQIDVIKSDLTKKADEFKMVLPSHITVDKFQRIVTTAALSNASLLGCDRKSLLLACMKLAQDGLLPDGREAALVPFKNRVKGDDGKFHDEWSVQAMPMAWGLRKKILQSGEVVSLETGLVYRAEVESGNFLYEIGIDPPIRHRPKLDMTDEEMADENIIAAYSIARLKNANGDPYWSVEVMRRSEINKVRQASQTGAVGRTIKFGADKGKVIEPKGPWVDWFGEMARKTVLRRHSKVLPMSGDILDTLERDDAEEARAVGAARLLEAEVDAPLRLPSNEDLDANGDSEEIIDQETGEVLARDPQTGMTEVSEEQARALDAGHGDDDDEIPAFEKPTEEEERPETDFTGAVMPSAATHGASWFNTADKVTRWARQTQHGIKWYLEPPKAEQQEAGQPAAGEPAKPSSNGSQSDDLLNSIRSAPNKTKLAAIENEYLKVAVGMTQEVASEIEAALMARKREFAAKVEG